MNKKAGHKKDDISFRRLISIGFNMTAGVGLGAYGGHLLDEKFHRKYLFLLIGTCLGMAWGFYEVFKLAYWIQKRPPADK